MAALQLARAPQAEQRVGIVRPPLLRPSKPLLTGLGITALQVQNTHEIEGPGMFRCLIKDLAIRGRRLIQPAGAMMMDSVL